MSARAQGRWLLPAAVAAMLSLAPACGGGGGPQEPFVVEIVAPDGDALDNPDPVFLNAVDELELLIMPQERSDQRFRDVSMRTFAGGEVTARVTTTGQYQMRLSRTWVTDNATPVGPAFRLQIPLFSQGGEPDPEIADPTVRATVIRADERIAETLPAPPVRWPLVEGNTRTFELVCNDGFEMQCQDMD